MERHAITVSGVVQGVGFRPFVYGLASRLRLHGFVKNRTGSVLIEVEGLPASLDQFADELQTHPPPLARISQMQRSAIMPRHELGFRIEPSDHEASTGVFISPDVATCPDCLSELFDVADRRYRYPFLNCTNCGPRLTIIEGAPYDRQRTTMARFPMCSACRAEYNDPSNRRFHAQPTACPACGPRLALLEPNGLTIATDDPLAVFVDRLRSGRIGALKGLGGYHLVCDASDEIAVSEMRRRKHRDEKPFAVMLRDAQTARTYCEIDSHEQSLLESPQRPIVLLRKRTSARNEIAEAVAPGNPYLGVMLPYTPLHHLLHEAVDGVPLVMTSGNRSDEPIVYLDTDAVARLGEIADILLSHDRPIHVRCDDSVTRIVDGQYLPIRRSRGYAPEPIALPLECPCPMLAVGGQQKSTFALGRERHAFLSHHLGDLDYYEASRAFERDVQLYQQLFAVQPALIVHDLHPDYASTNYAQHRAAEQSVRLFAVQHHHAHVASCMAEHGLNEPVIGVAFDGTGYGTDGAIWGGEFLVGDYSGFTRAAHLRYVRMPGADKAIHEPWRMAASHLLDAGMDSTQLRDNSHSQRRIVEQMIEREFNSPITSSAGRLFDAVAAIAGVRSHTSYEGHGAVELEWLATDITEDGAYPFELFADEIDTRPLISAVADDARAGMSAARIARRFHSTIVRIILAVCERCRDRTQTNVVVLSGGVFMNALLAREVPARLESAGFRVYRHRLVPPNDGGLSLGQLAIAAKCEVRRERHDSSRNGVSTGVEEIPPAESLARTNNIA